MTTSDSFDPTKLSLQKLNSTNFLMWAHKVEVILRGKCLWNIVNGSETAPTTPEALHKFNQRQDQAITILLLSIEDSCLAPVITMRDPKKIWETLSSSFRTSSEASVDVFLHEYQSLSMGDSEKVMAYINRMTELENKLSSVGHTLTDADKKRAMLRGLRGEFKVIAGVIRATEKSVQDAIGLLFVQEAENNAINSSAVKKNVQVFKAEHGGRKRTCFFCKKPGHVKKNCFKNPDSPRFKGKKEEPSNDKKQKMNSDIPIPANVLSFMAQEYQAGKNCRSWIIDSGASAHMCNNESYFKNFRSDAPVETVSIGNGNQLRVAGIGSIHADTVVHGIRQSVVLKDVLCVSELS